MHRNKYGEIDAKLYGLHAILSPETDGERRKVQRGYWLSWKYLFLKKIKVISKFIEKIEGFHY